MTLPLLTPVLAFMIWSPASVYAVDSGLMRPT